MHDMNLDKILFLQIVKSETRLCFETMPEGSGDHSPPPFIQLRQVLIPVDWMGEHKYFHLPIGASHSDGQLRVVRLVAHCGGIIDVSVQLSHYCESKFGFISQTIFYRWCRRGEFRSMRI